MGSWHFCAISQKASKHDIDSEKQQARGVPPNSTIRTNEPVSWNKETLKIQFELSQWISEPYSNLRSLNLLLLNSSIQMQKLVLYRWHYLTAYNLSSRPEEQKNRCRPRNSGLLGLQVAYSPSKDRSQPSPERGIRFIRHTCYAIQKLNTQKYALINRICRNVDPLSIQRKF